MRAILQWLALAPLLVLSGCRTHLPPPPPASSGSSLSREDGALAEALAHYSQALICEATLGEAQSGLLHFRQAAASDPSFLPLNLKVAVDYLGRRDYTGAVAVLSRTAKFHPDSDDLQLLLGTVFQAQGKPDEASAAYRTAIRLKPDRAEGYVRLATLKMVGLAARDSLAVIDSGLARVKDKAPLLDFCDSVGRIYLSGKDARGAIPFLERVVSNRPDQDEVRELLARCYAASGRGREAVAELEAILKRRPDQSQLLILLGELYEEQGNAERALGIYQRATAGVAPESLAFVRLANLQLATNGDTALNTLRGAVGRFPDDIRLRLVLALLCVRLDRAEEAISHFERIAGTLGRDPEVAKLIQPMFYFWYGGACERAGRLDDAERLMARYLEINPNSAEAMNTLAYLWAEQGRNLDQALVYITKALEREPGNGAYLDTLGWVQYKKGDYDRALGNLTRALKKEGDDPAILEHLGDTWLALKRKDKAIRTWKKSLRINPANQALRAKLLREGAEAGSLPPVGGTGR